jgi:mono/diheme cytochrome c family protein
MIQGLFRRLLSASLALFFLLAAHFSAADAAGPVIPGFERFHTGDKADPARGGHLLLGELNCISCHQTESKATARKQAPVLDSVGTRVRVGHLRKFLSDPQAVKPGTTMPHLLANDPEREQKVEALVHFLSSTGIVKQERPQGKNVGTGRDLYHKVGCVACHGTRKADGSADLVLPSSVPLGNLKEKYSITSLSLFLESPHLTRPSGRMPQILNGKESKEVATFLLQGIKTPPPMGRGTTTYAYYEGDWDKLPDFSKMKAQSQGTGVALDLTAARRGNNYGLRFEGYFQADREADYTFATNSDDGSKIYVDGKLVVDNDGIHPPQTRRGKIKLTKGNHKVTLDFFQGGGGAELSAQVEAPGFGSYNLAELLAATEADLEKKKPEVKNDDPDYLEIQPALVEKGKALFASSGCASCHQMTVNKQPLLSSLTAPVLGKVEPGKGCLADAPQSGKPWYALSASQRAALMAAIKTPVPPASTPKEKVAETFVRLNCYACHVRDKVGGRLEELDKSFQTVQPEMGDEGRLPPPLDGVGAKLNPAYLKQLLDKGAHDRPYMHTRMPGFGDANVGHLIEAFAALDSLPETPAVKFEQTPARVKATARHLVGAQAFGCIKCHTFAGQKAEGVQGIDMAIMTQRVRRDWFHAYVSDPQSIRPGTRMPAAFLKGKSVLPEFLDGTALQQVEAMWAYLSDGTKAQLPLGASAKSIPLMPTDGAILYRNFIDGGGPRAIGVGYPERIHLTFDANDLRLALLWEGAFIDAARHWTDRGVGQQGPLGDNVLKLAGGTPFAILGKDGDAWPGTPARQRGYRFLGYRLSVDDRPTFLYSVEGVKVEDLPTPVADKVATLRRSLKLTSEKPVEGLSYRAATGNKIEAKEDGWYLIDGTWRVKLEGAAPAQIRTIGGKMELIVPVRFADGKAEILQTYKW